MRPWVSCFPLDFFTLVAMKLSSGLRLLVKNPICTIHWPFDLEQLAESLCVFVSAFSNENMFAYLTGSRLA